MPSPNIPTLDSAIVFPGTVHIEGTNGLRRARDDAALRAGRRAVDQGREVCRGAQRARAARRVLPARGVRADVSEARARRRAAGARSTCSIARAFKPVLTGVAMIDEAARRRSGELRLEAAAVRVRARQAADRRDRGSPSRSAPRSTPASAPNQSPGGGSRRVEAFRALRQPYLLYAGTRSCMTAWQPAGTHRRTHGHHPGAARARARARFSMPRTRRTGGR